jgi:hypothetical protein
MQEWASANRAEAAQAQTDRDVSVAGSVPGGATAGMARGGKVKKTGKTKIHKGEYVLKKSAAERMGTKRLNRMNRAGSDKRMLQRTPFNRGR